MTTKEDLAEEKHEPIMGILKGEMGLVRPTINRVNSETIVVTLPRYMADALIDCVDGLDGYIVTLEEQIPKQPRDMHSYNSIEITKLD